MSDSDVAYLRSRQPFASLDPKAFPRTVPLESILRNDCRLCRVEAGEIVARAGDNESSAFLVLSGGAVVMIDSLSNQRLDSCRPKLISHAFRKVADWLRPIDSGGLSRPAAIAYRNDPLRRNPSGSPDASSVVPDVDGRSAISFEDLISVLESRENVKLGPGEFYGEIAAMNRLPRTATMIAETEANLLEIRWQGLNLLRLDPQFADPIESHYRKHWLPVDLREVPLFGDMPGDHLAAVAGATEMRSYGRSAWNINYEELRPSSAVHQIEKEPLVVDEGRSSNELIIVRAGLGRLCRRNGEDLLTVGYLSKGQVFGLAEVAFNAVREPGTSPRTNEYQLRAVDFLDTLHVPAEVFAADVLPYVRRERLPADVAKLMLWQDGSSSKSLVDAGSKSAACEARTNSLLARLSACSTRVLRQLAARDDRSEAA